MVKNIPLPTGTIFSTILFLMVTVLATLLEKMGSIFCTIAVLLAASFDTLLLQPSIILLNRLRVFYRKITVLIGSGLSQISIQLFTVFFTITCLIGTMLVIIFVKLGSFLSPNSAKSGTIELTSNVLSPGTLTLLYNE